MVVVIIRIAVRCHNDLKPFAPQPFGQLYPNRVGGLGIHLAGTEGLVSMIANAVAALVPIGDL